MGRHQAVGDDHALDHVANHSYPRATLELNGHRRAAGVSTKRTLYANDARRTAETWRNETPRPRLARQRPGGVGELDGGEGVGGHTSMMTGACGKDRRPNLCHTRWLVSIQWTNQSG